MRAACVYTHVHTLVYTHTHHRMHTHIRYIHTCTVHTYTHTHTHADTCVHYLTARPEAGSKTERETDRERDRQRERQTERETDRERHRHSEQETACTYTHTTRQSTRLTLLHDRVQDLLYYTTENKTCREPQAEKEKKKENTTERKKKEKNRYLTEYMGPSCREVQAGMLSGVMMCEFAPQICSQSDLYLAAWCHPQGGEGGWGGCHEGRSYRGQDVM